MQEYYTQKSIKESVSISGIALHTACRAHLTFKPAKANTGIVFIRKDLTNEPQIKALGTNVSKVNRATTIQVNDAFVHTVEHVLAALNSLEIDNCYIEMDREEPPILDGSSKIFIDKLKEAQVQTLDAKTPYFQVTKKHTITLEHSTISVEPCNEFRISCKVDYDHPLSKQDLSLKVNSESFYKELSEARTFCLYKELEYLINANLIKGGSLDNACVLYQDVILSNGGLRYNDELVRHKMLDCVGDFTLLGRFLKAHIIADKPGHPSNVKMVQHLLELEKNGAL